MTAIHAPVSVVRGYRQSQTIQVGTRFPLHRSSSLCRSHGMRQKEQSIRFTLISTMRIATNLLSTDNVSCIQDAMRACLTSVWTESGDDNVDGSSYNDYFVHPFSVQSMQSEPYLMMCIHGSSENCSSLLPEAEREELETKVLAFVHSMGISRSRLFPCGSCSHSVDRPFQHCEHPK